MNTSFSKIDTTRRRRKRNFAARFLLRLMDAPEATSHFRSSVTKALAVGVGVRRVCPKPVVNMVQVVQEEEKEEALEVHRRL